MKIVVIGLTWLAFFGAVTAYNYGFNYGYSEAIVEILEHPSICDGER